MYSRDRDRNLYRDTYDVDARDRSPERLRPVRTPRSPVRRIRFYDDDPGHITAVQEAFPDTIQSIQVPRHPLILSGRTYLEYLRSPSSGWDLTGEDADLGRMVEYFETHGLTNEPVVSQGLQRQDFDDLQDWAERLPEQPGRRIKGKVFFDWDQVLNHLEGMRVHASITILRQVPELSPSAYVKMCFGTNERYRMIHSTISMLMRQGVEVHIVTNNAGCTNDDEEAIFGHIAAALNPRIQVHCCRTYPNKAFCIDARAITSGLSFGNRRRRRNGGGVRTFTNLGRV